MMHRLNILVSLSMLLAVVLLVSLFFYRAWKLEKGNYQRILEASVLKEQEQMFLHARNGQLVNETRVLQLRASELAKVLPQIEQELKNLRVKLARVESFSQSSFQVEKKVVVTLRDSLVPDTIHIQVFDYNDGFFKVHGKSDGISQTLELAYQDTLIQVVYKGPRDKPWLWIFSKRKLMQRVSLKNPNARIHYSQFIKIEQ